MYIPLSFSEEIHLPIYVYGSRHVRLAPDPVPEFNESNYFRMLYIKRGGGILTDRFGVEHRLKHDTVISIPAGACALYDPNDAASEADIILAGGIALDALMSGFQLGDFRVLDANKNIRSMFENILSLNDRPTIRASLNLSDKLYRLIISLGIFNMNSGHSKLAPAVALIHRSFNSDISAADMAGASGYDKSYFIRLFKSVYGVTPIQYLRDVRIENAKRLLVSYPARSVKDISRDCGFRNDAYFGKVFKEAAGVSPDTYRKTHIASL